MPRKHRKANGDTQPKVDDFKLIKGITHNVDKCLHAADIQTYSQLACLTPQEVLSILGKGYSIRRIEKENWIGQAQDLIQKSNLHKPDKKETIRQTTRQHYENFTIELLLNEKNLARRTHIIHVQSGDADTWAGWETEQVFNFVLRHTGMRPPSTKSATARSLKRNSAASTPMLIEQSIPITAETVSELPIIKESKKNPGSFPASTDLQSMTHRSALVEDRSLESSPQKLSSKGGNATSLMLLDWKITLPDKDQSLHNIPQEQAFNVHLTLDINHASLPKQSPLNCTATLYAKKLGSKTRLSIGETKQILPFDRILPLKIQGIIVSKGIYRLETHVTIQPAGLEVDNKQKIMSFLESGPLQIY